MRDRGVRRRVYVELISDVVAVSPSSPSVAVGDALSLVIRVLRSAAVQWAAWRTARGA